MLGQVVLASLFSKAELTISIDENGSFNVCARGISALLAMVLFKGQLLRLRSTAPKLPHKRVPAVI